MDAKVFNLLDLGLVSFAPLVVLLLELLVLLPEAVNGSLDLVSVALRVVPVSGLELNDLVHLLLALVALLLNESKEFGLAESAQLGCVFATKNSSKLTKMSLSSIDASRL